MTAKKIPIIYIEWQDAHNNTGWFTKEELDKWKLKDWLCQNAGFMIEETDRHLVFAQRHEPEGHANGEEQWGGLHKIPKAWIRNKRILGYISSDGKFCK